MIIPGFLKPGDRIHIVSPAGKVSRDSVLKAADWLMSQGFAVTFGEHAFDESFQFSGTDLQRITDLQKALDEPSVNAIFCSRGGYGTIRLLEKIDFSGIQNHPKWLVGFSDITVLHCVLNNLGVASVHGIMPKLFFDESGEKTENIESLMNLLSGKDAVYSIGPHPLNRSGSAAGELVGGNLSLMQSLQSTPFELKTYGKILFIEDTGEYLYRLDRMMHNLKLSGKLKNLKGLIVGEFADVKDNPDPFGKEVYEIILEAIQEYSYPVCFGFPAGHGGRNLALTFGQHWDLWIGADQCIIKTG